jgi:hypothetical protein
MPKNEGFEQKGWPGSNHLVIMSGMCLWPRASELIPLSPLRKVSMKRAIPNASTNQEMTISEFYVAIKIKL